MSSAAGWRSNAPCTAIVCCRSKPGLLSFKQLTYVGICRGGVVGMAKQLLTKPTAPATVVLYRPSSRRHPIRSEIKTSAGSLGRPVRCSAAAASGVLSILPLICETSTSSGGKKMRGPHTGPRSFGFRDVSVDFYSHGGTELHEFLRSLSFKPSTCLSMWALQYLANAGRW